MLIRGDHRQLLGKGGVGKFFHDHRVLRVTLLIHYTTLHNTYHYRYRQYFDDNSHLSSCGYRTIDCSADHYWNLDWCMAGDEEKYSFHSNRIR